MLTKKYYDGFIVHDILNKHLDDGHKILELLTAFADADGVDAVEVVRCKDCHYCKPFNEVWQLPKKRSLCCGRTKWEVEADDYCSGAFRRWEE